MPVVKFTLTYEGELGSNGRPAKKWEIRQYFHPQLVELWRVNPVLKMAERERIVQSKGPFHYIDQRHSVDAVRR